MTRRLRCLLAAAWLLRAAPALGQGASVIEVGPNVQVSRAQPDMSHDEVFISADPDDPNRLIACSIFRPSTLGEGRTIVYASFDAGRVWTPVLTARAGYRSPFALVADPACAFGVNGTAYAAAISMEERRRLRAWRSPDGGRTWSEAVVTDKDIADRVTLLADAVSQKYRGRVYIYGQTVGRDLDGKEVPFGGGFGLALWRSLDGGATYERPVQRFVPAGKRTLRPSSATVLSDGTFLGLVSLAGGLYVIASRDGGTTLDPWVKVADRVGEGDDNGGLDGGSYLAADVFTETFKDRLYAVWVDRRFGNRGQVLIAHSTDQGRTWSRPRIVNDDRLPRRDTLERPASPPHVAVNRDGVVGVWWQDRRENQATDLSYDVRFAASLDGGLTFTPSVRVSEQRHVVGGRERWMTAGYVIPPDSTVANVRISRDEWVGGGHYAGIAVDAGGGFHPLWVDNRTGVHQVWTARVTVRGKAVRHGAAELSRLADLTARTAIELTDNAFDPATRELRVTLRVKNVSQATVAGPLKLRLLLVLSQLGVPEVLGADNGVGREGAVWDFTGLIPAEGLKPGERSKEKVLKFRLHHVQPWQPGLSTLVEFDAVVLGRAVSPVARSQ